MLSWATETDVAGHMWPAGRYLSTPELGQYFSKVLMEVFLILFANG